MGDRRAWPVVAATLVLTIALSPGAAADERPSALHPPPRPGIPDKVVLRVYESTFNGLADALGPLKLTGHYDFGVTACVPMTSLCTTTDICNSDWTVTVSHLHFSISPSKIAVTGQGDAAWCGVGSTFTLGTTAEVAKTSILIFQPGSHQASTTLDAVRVSVSPTSAQPVLGIPGYSVKLPIRIDVGPALTLPVIPLTTSLVSFETAAGPQSLRLSPAAVTIVKRDHYVELHSGLRLW